MDKPLTSIGTRYTRIPLYLIRAQYGKKREFGDYEADEEIRIRG